MRNLCAQAVDDHIQSRMEIVLTATHEDIDARRAIFGPGVNRDMGFCQQGDAGNALTRPKAVKADFQQPRARRSRRCDQACLDLRGIRQIAGMAQIGDEMVSDRHNRLSWGWPSSVIARSAASTPR